MAELCSSTEMDVSSASHGKPEKICLVCGDKALGYNFNAVSCESCKAFFRRNAHKTIRGRCEGRCEVTVESRSFCKRCRLAKCFTIGMRKDMILNEEQKKQRKQKIITNKLRRQGQLPQGSMLPDGSSPYDPHLSHPYLKPASPRELAMMDMSVTGPGKHGNDFLHHQSPHRLPGHLMGRYPYPTHDPYNIQTGYNPTNMGKSVSSGSMASQSGSSGNTTGYPSPSPMLPESSLSPSSSSSPLQQQKYYNNQHHHRHHHHHQQQQQRQHQYLNHHHQQQPQQHQQHSSHQEGQYYTPQMVAMKQESYGHIERIKQDQGHSEKMAKNFSHRRQVTQIPGVQPIHIKQEVPDSITDSPEANSTHSPPLTKYTAQTTHASLNTSSLSLSADARGGGSLSDDNTSPGNTLDPHTIISSSKMRLFQPSQKSSPSSPISPSSSTSPRLNSGCAVASYSESSPTLSSPPSTSSSMGTTTTKSSGPSTNPLTPTTASYKPGMSHNTPCQVRPWSEGQDLVNAAIEFVGSDGARDIREMMHAMEVGTFFDGNRTARTIPTTPEEFVNTAELFVRKVIKFAKNLNSFKSLLRGDQVGLLKSSVVDIMMLRSAINYDPFTETWSLNTKGCMAQGANQTAGARISAEILKSGTEGTKRLFLTYSKFIKSLMSTVHGDRVILELLILISLFSADRLPLEQHEKIQAIQEHYAFLLQRYVAHRFDAEKTLFAQIIMKLADLRDINEIHSDMLLHMKVDKLDPLLVEIFELPPTTDVVEDDGNVDKKQEHPLPSESVNTKADIPRDSNTGFSQDKVQRENPVTTSGYPYGSQPSYDGRVGSNLSPDGIQEEEQQQQHGVDNLQTPALPRSSATSPTFSGQGQSVPMEDHRHHQDISPEKHYSAGQGLSVSPTSTLSPTSNQSPVMKTSFSPPLEISKLGLSSFPGSANEEKPSQVLMSEAQTPMSSPSSDPRPVQGRKSVQDEVTSPSLSKYPCHRQSPKLPPPPSGGLYSSRHVDMEF